MFCDCARFSESMPGTHILTIALEEYFHAPAFRGVIGEKSWGRFEMRYERSTRSALDLLARSESRATFFVGPWLARKCPDVLREIVRQGHEIALSGDRGPGFRTLAPAAFREVVRRGRAAVEESCGHEILGYRRSDVLLRRKHLAGLEVLAEEGFLYDSSLSPMAWAFPGEPWRRFVHKQRFAASSIWEFPLSSQSVGGLMIPFAGGNYFRQYPQAAVRWFVRHWDAAHDQPLVLYFRLWDLDPTQPRIHTGSFVRDVRHYRNGDQIVKIIGELFDRYRFESIAGSLDREQQLSSVIEPGIPASINAVTFSNGVRERVPVSIVIPCYNEEASIPYLARSLDELKASLTADYDVQFILVNDGSSDGTARLLEQLFGSRRDSLLLRHERNRGVAAAVWTGLEHAREIACSMDCDCSYDPHELKPMLRLLDCGVDLVTASPYHPKGRVSNVPAWRIGLSRGASILYQVVTGRKIHTFTSCLRVYRRSAALATPLQHPGFLGIAELAGRFALSGRTIVEHPATLELRLFGRSKMRIARTIAGHLDLLASLAWSRLTRRAMSVQRADGPGHVQENLAISTEIKPSGLNS
jgi:polysaccharide deacetylase family protein (PEP-CTERM system associated)